jgi:methionyl-tRNA formyltransferase
MVLRIVFFGNSESLFSNRHFHALEQTGCEVIGVVDAPPAQRNSTNSQSPGSLTFVTSARKRGIPVFDPSSPQHPEFLAQLGDLAPDMILAAGYPIILRQPVLSIPRLVPVNFHASLLPAYRGKHPVFWCLRNDERWSGLTVHVMDPGIDTGDILYQVRVPTRKSDTVHALYDRIVVKSVKLVPRLVRDAENGAIKRTPQQEAGRSYFSSIREEDFRLCWSQDVRQLRRWITMTPGECFVMVTGERVYFLDAEIIPTRGEHSPGKILGLHHAGGTIAVGGGALRLRQIRRENGSTLSLPGLCEVIDLGVGDVLPCS